MMSIYDGISSLYEKWSSGDAVYEDTFKFYTSTLMRMTKGRYIELGIGTGRISTEVVRHTPITIVGIDASTKMLEKCLEQYEKITDCKGELILKRENFIFLNYQEEFDGAIMPFRTIGHIMNDSELKYMFHNVFKALKPGGWFLFDHYMFQREWAESHNKCDIIMYSDDEITICDQYHYDFENEKMFCEIKLNGNVIEAFEFRWMSPELIRNMAENAGFEITSLMGEFDGTEWSMNSLEQIWLLKKPGDCMNSKLP